MCAARRLRRCRRALTGVPTARVQDVVVLLDVLVHQLLQPCIPLVPVKGLRVPASHAARAETAPARFSSCTHFVYRWSQYAACPYCAMAGNTARSLSLGWLGDEAVCGLCRAAWPAGAGAGVGKQGGGDSGREWRGMRRLRGRVQCRGWHGAHARRTRLPRTRTPCWGLPAALGRIRAAPCAGTWQCTLSDTPPRPSSPAPPCPLRAAWRCAVCWAWRQRPAGGDACLSHGAGAGPVLQRQHL